MQYNRIFQNVPLFFFLLLLFLLTGERGNDVKKKMLPQDSYI